MIGPHGPRPFWTLWVFVGARGQTSGDMTLLLTSKMSQIGHMATSILLAGHGCPKEADRVKVLLLGPLGPSRGPDFCVLRVPAMPHLLLKLHQGDLWVL